MKNEEEKLLTPERNRLFLNVSPKNPERWFAPAWGFGRRLGFFFRGFAAQPVGHDVHDLEGKVRGVLNEK